MKIFILILFLFFLNFNLRGEVLTLHRAVEIGLENSSLLKSLYSKNKILKSKYNYNIRNFFPDLSLSYNNVESVSYMAEDYRERSAALNLSYEINLNRKDLIERRITNLDKYLVGIEIFLEKEKIISAIENIYYDTILAWNEILINKELLNNLNIYNMIIKKEIELGLATNYKKFQIAAKISESKYKIKMSKNSYKNNLSNLLTYIKYSGKADIKLNKINDNLEIYRTKKNQSDLVNVAILNRLDLKKIKYNIKKAEYKMVLEKRYYYPKIKIEGSYGYEGDRFPLNKKFWNIGLSVTSVIFGNSISSSHQLGESDNRNNKKYTRGYNMNLYDKYLYGISFLESNADYRDILNSYNMLKNSIRLEVVRNLDDYFEKIEMIYLAKENVELILKGILIEKEKYRVGELTLRELLEVYFDLSKAKVTKIKSVIEHHKSLNKFQRSLGVKISQYNRL